MELIWLAAITMVPVALVVARVLQPQPLRVQAPSRKIRR